MRLPDEEELEASGVEAGVHLQLDRRRRTSSVVRSRAASDRISNAARAARDGVIVALVEQQQGVAAELEQAAALCVGDGEQRGEGRVHHLCDFFRAGSAEAGEPLGHRGEPRDVDECERALDLAPLGLGMVAEPFERQPRDERDELGRRRVLDGSDRRSCRVILRESPGRSKRLRFAAASEPEPRSLLHGTFTRSSTQSPRKGDVRYVVLDE